MDADRSRRIDEVYRRALEQEAGRRADFVERECGGDPDLCRAVEARLAESNATVNWVPPELRQLGVYKLEARLGAGGMGEVFRAVDTRLDRTVAIKLVKHEFSTRFEREARAISALNHRHVCTLYDVGPNFLVMELIDGDTLADRIHRGPLPFAQVLQYGAEIAEALAAAHAQGIIHRDLKPGNVMIAGDGVKVLDFGLAKLTTGPVGTPTETRLAMATPMYMAPEQALGLECSSATDLFALGLVLYEMVAGTLPFPGASLGSMLALGEVSIPKPCRRRSMQARRLNALILRLLEKDAGKRPAGAAEVARTLREMTRQAERGTWLWPVGLAASLLLAVAVLFWHGMPGAASDSALQVSRVEMVTNYPGDETTPAVSPDGSRVAFAWRSDQGVRIYMTSPSGEENPTQMTHDAAAEQSDATADRYPAWSPDGRTVAFVRSRGATSGEIMTMPAEGGAERALRQIRLVYLSASQWLTWSPDGAALVFSEASRLTGRATLFTLRLADGSVQPLIEPPDGVSGDTSPAFSPDGRSLAFTRWRSPGSSSVLVQTLGDDGRPTADPVAVAHGRSPVWFDAKRLLFVDGTRILEWRAGGSPQQVYVSSEQLLGLAVAARRDGGLPALVVAQQNSAGPRLWTLPLKGAGQAAGRPELKTRFGSFVANPDFSPDGRHVAFASGRSGTPEIWVADRDGAHVTQLTKLGLRATGIPRWAPDSRRIAFFARMPDEPQIYLIDSSHPEAGPRQVTHEVPGCNVPSWSRDGTWLYCSRRIAGELRLYRVKLAAEGHDPQLERLFEGKEARETADGRILYVKDDHPGLFSRSLAGNPLDNPEERLVDDIIGPIAYYAATAHGVYYRAQDSFGRYVGLRFFDYARHAAIDVAPRNVTGDMGALAVSPDESELLYVRGAQPGVDLALIEFR
jgi:Tol biopolymer transport system component/predicted Ser/Thr protein kinase